MYEGGGRLSRPQERRPPMTMFSMKPKFDLAAFIAESEKKGVRPKAKTFRRTKPVQADPAPAATDETAESAETDGSKPQD